MWSAAQENRTMPASQGWSFRVLGPLLVTCDGQPIAIRRPRQRAVLGFLLLHAGQLVTTERLIDAVWGDRPPTTARAQVQADIAGIRKALGPLGTERLATVPAGYRFTAGADELDCLYFDTVLARAMRTPVGDPDRDLPDLRTALDLWRGSVLADIDAAYVASARAHLHRRRLEAFERLVDVELNRGSAAELADELAKLVDAEPLRERLRAQLMIIYYRLGRRAEALALGRDLRRVLADDHGLDPGSDFQRVERMILCDDPELVIDHASDVNPFPPPQELPADIADFVGRTGELATVRALLCDTLPAARSVAVITGSPGIGKTTLAVRIAHAVRDRYPDGQVFLRMQDASGQRLPDLAAVWHVLRALGVGENHLPGTVDEGTARLRTLLAGRRLLLILDDVQDERQVAILRPGTTGSALLVTTRSRLVNPPGGHLVELTELPEPDSIRLLSGLATPAQQAGQEVLLEVVRLCCGLPLALRVVGGQLRARPHRGLADIAGRLRDERNRLQELTHADLNVGASIGLSVQRLPVPQRRVLEGLAATDLRRAAAWLVAAQHGVAEAAAADALDGLTASYLVAPDSQQTDRVRFSSHDLVRLHVRTLTPPARREKLIDATYAAYHDLALSARAVLAPAMTAVSGTPSGRVNADPAAMLALLDTEIDNFAALIRTAATSDRQRFAWQTAYLLFGYFDRGRRLDEAIAITQYAVDASRELVDARAERIMLGHHAATCNMARRHERALVSLDAVLKLADAAGEPRAVMVARAGLGRTHRQLGQVTEAIKHYRAGLAVAGQANDRQALALLSHALGAAYVDLGEFEAATSALEDARRFARTLEDRSTDARALLSLAGVAAGLDRPLDALDLLSQARAIAVGAGYQSIEAEIAIDTGVLLSRIGDRSAASDVLRHALALNRATGDRTRELTTLRALSSLRHATGAKPGDESDGGSSDASGSEEYAQPALRPGQPFA
jgi:DNA-binding SARP family transcriptional activator/tetratricopeptide (TPR) repeat protein